jgi:hypothetical protein
MSVTTETDSLLNPPRVNRLERQTYTTITQDPETGHNIFITQKEKRAWLWTSNSYAWSLATLIILLLTFSALEYALLKLNLPAVNP